MWTRPKQARAIALDSKRRSETIDALSARYGGLTCPILLVVGTSDRFIDPEGQALRFAREHPAAALRTISGAGHQIPQTRPDEVIDAVRTLMKEAAESTHHDGGVT
jgi:pimeloyl-ACP methyl ester carboxylesterase